MLRPVALRVLSVDSSDHLDEVVRVFHFPMDEPKLLDVVVGRLAIAMDDSVGHADTLDYR